MKTYNTAGRNLFEVIPNLPITEFQINGNIDEMIAHARVCAANEPKSLRLKDILIRFWISENQFFR